MEKLDKKDKRLLFELYKDARASATQLASKIDLSKEAVSYRLKRLEEKEILKKVMAVADISALGFNLFHVQIRLTPQGKLKKEELIKEFRLLPELSWVIEVSGDWDFVLIFMAKSIHDFKGVYEKFLLKTGKYIDKKTSSTIFSIDYFSPNYLLEEKERIRISQSMKLSTYSLDKNQERIINLLEDNGRMSLIDLANNLGVSISTIKHHLKVLEKNKILLTYIPLLEIRSLGIDRYRVVFQLTNPSETKKFSELLSINPHVTTIIKLLGVYDVEIECEYSSVEKLLEDIRTLETVVAIRSFDIMFFNKKIEVRGIPDYNKDLKK
jgi:Lrp/AsnC family transcriptional regulator, leucine-responsive regulatory protein